MNGYGLGPLSDAVRTQALANLPEPVRKILEAENRVREMVATAETPFEDIERVAVLAGMAPPDPEGRQANSGRWSYHPGGFFIRFLPHGYSRTRIELYVPEQLPLVDRDSHGRITSVRDGPRAGDASDAHLVASRPLRQFDPSNGPAMPGNRNAQRLGMSGGKAGGDESGPSGHIRHAHEYTEGGKFAIEMAVEGPVSAARSFWGFAIPNFMVSKILEFNFDTWGAASDALAGDPPRSDYKTYAKIEKLTFVPLTPGPDLPPARAAVGNRLMHASLDLSATLRAALVSLDRAGGANQAGDTVWGWRQGAALMYYKREAGAAMLTTADRLEAMIHELRDEGLQDIIVRPEAVRQYQARLRTAGFSTEDLQAARAINLSDEEIEEIRQSRIAGDPATLAGSITEAAAKYAAALRIVGRLFTALPAVSPPWTEESGR